MIKNGYKRYLIISVVFNVLILLAFLRYQPPAIKQRMNAILDKIEQQIDANKTVDELETLQQLLQAIEQHKTALTVLEGRVEKYLDKASLRAEKDVVDPFRQDMNPRTSYLSERHLDSLEKYQSLQKEMEGYSRFREQWQQMNQNLAEMRRLNERLQTMRKHLEPLEALESPETPQDQEQPYEEAPGDDTDPTQGYSPSGRVSR